MLLKHLTIFFYYHPKSGKILLALHDIGYILIGASLALLVCYKIGILAVSPEEMKAVLLLLIFLLSTSLIGGAALVIHANESFDKSIISDNFFMIAKRHPLQLGYDYIEALLPKLEEICGKMTVRAIYAYKTPKNPADETLPLSTGYRDTWKNDPGRKIIEIKFESAENSSTDRHLTLSYRRAYYPVVMYYTGSHLEGKGFDQDDRERIINVIENERWRLKPKYSLLVNISLGFTYFFFFIVSLIFNYLYWDDSYGHIAWFILNMIIMGILLLILCVKNLYFPEGTFSIDHEVEEIKERERTQEKIIGYMEKSFVGGLLFIIFGVRPI